MRTQEEIIERIEQKKQLDIFGVHVGRLCHYLTWENAKPYYQEEWIKKVESGEEKYGQGELTRDNVIAEIAQYMPFAWDKANNCRGLSAGQSIEHMNALCWLLGEDDLVEKMEDPGEYYNYGKPLLEIICEKFELDWKQWDNGYRGNSEDDQVKVVEGARGR